MEHVDQIFDYTLNDNTLKISLNKARSIQPLKIYDIWSKVIKEIINSTNLYVIVELCPSEAGEIRESLKNEIIQIDKENALRNILLKESINTKYHLYQYLIVIDDFNYLDYLIGCYYDHYQLRVFLSEEKIRFIDKQLKIFESPEETRISQFDSLTEIGVSILIEFDFSGRIMEITAVQQFHESIKSLRIEDMYDR